MTPDDWTQREQQWKYFHEWEGRLTDLPSLQPAIEWFSEAYELLWRFRGSGGTLPDPEKIERIRKQRRAFSKLKIDT
jgi:hypothetical protein